MCILLFNRRSEKNGQIVRQDRKSLVVIIAGSVLVGPAQGKPQPVRFSRESACSYEVNSGFLSAGRKEGLNLKSYGKKSTKYQKHQLLRRYSHRQGGVAQMTYTLNSHHTFYGKVAPKIRNGSTSGQDKHDPHLGQSPHGRTPTPAHNDPQKKGGLFTEVASEGHAQSEALAEPLLQAGPRPVGTTRACNAQEEIRSPEAQTAWASGATRKTVPVQFSHFRNKADCLALTSEFPEGYILTFNTISTNYTQLYKHDVKKSFVDNPQGN